MKKERERKHGTLETDVVALRFTVPFKPLRHLGEKKKKKRRKEGNDTLTKMSTLDLSPLLQILSRCPMLKINLRAKAKAWHMP